MFRITKISSQYMQTATPLNLDFELSSTIAPIPIVKPNIIGVFLWILTETMLNCLFTNLHILIYWQKLELRTTILYMTGAGLTRVAS